MLNDTTAAATFSDDWDSEEPTVLDRDDLRCFAPTAYLLATPGNWNALDDAAIRAVLNASDDLTATSGEMPAVTF
jgi:hypothetical protein